MKVLVNFARIFVGVLFIFSGFVKMVDPLGFSYKLEEYLGPAVFDIGFLEPHSLVLAVVLVIFELLLGVMLLLGYAMNFTRWSLLLMIVFFTFLTFYSAYFNKVTDCGCFGDAIPLDPWESFFKDVILLVLIILIFIKSHYIRPLLKTNTSKWIIFILFIGCLALTYRVLTHLPVIDFRAYKIGNNIPEKRMAVGNEIPKIQDFYVFSEEGEIADELLEEEKLLMIVSYKLELSDEKGWQAVKEASEQALSNGYKIVGITSSSDRNIEEISEKYNLNFPFYAMDETASKTIIRANPGLVTLESGTVTQKAHWRDVKKLTFAESSQ